MTISRRHATARPESEAPQLRLQDFLPHQLNVLSSLVSQALTRVYGRYGISIPEWRVLVTLGQYGTMTGKAVGEQTHMHKTKVSRAVAQLERRKFVSRKVNRSDLREVFLSLTPAGRAVYDELAPQALEFTACLADAVSASDRSAFDRVMNQLTERSAALVGVRRTGVEGRMPEIGGRSEGGGREIEEVSNSTQYLRSEILTSDI